MKWSRIVYCAVFMAVLTILVVQGVSPWITVSLGALAAYWTYFCTRALWHVASLRVAVWRANLLPPVSLGDWIKPHKREEKLWWLASPKLDPAMDIITFVGVCTLSEWWIILYYPVIFAVICGGKRFTDRYPEKSPQRNRAEMALGCAFLAMPSAPLIVFAVWFVSHA
jgi:hypothetical protein